MARRKRKLRPSVADVVRVEMERQGLTQSDIARRCMVDQATVSRLLAGKNVRLDQAEQIMAVLGIKVVPPGRE